MTSIGLIIITEFVKAVPTLVGAMEAELRHSFNLFASGTYDFHTCLNVSWLEVLWRYVIVAEHSYNVTGVKRS